MPPGHHEGVGEKNPFTQQPFNFLDGLEPCLFLFLAAPNGRILAPGPRIQPVPSALEAWSLHHWTTSEVLGAISDHAFFFFLG